MNIFLENIYNLSFLNSLFEAVSGFTSTGFTVFDNIKHIDQGLILWRSSIQWIGGLYFLYSIIFLIDIFSTKNWQIITIIYIWIICILFFILSKTKIIYLSSISILCLFITFSSNKIDSKKKQKLILVF